MRELRYHAVLFDKDGTLLDVDQTWSPAIAAAIRDIAPHEPTQSALAGLMGFDLRTGHVLPNAPIMTLSNEQIANLAQPLTDGRAFINSVAEHVVDTLTPVEDAAATIDALRELGLPLAIVTNDEEASTNEQLASLGWAGHFEVVYGYNSGHGCKPEPDVLLAAAQHLGAEPSKVMMVGDSTTDLLAARGAGMLAVLIGADDTHAHLADVHIRQLSEILDLV